MEENIDKFSPESDLIKDKIYLKEKYGMDLFCYYQTNNGSSNNMEYNMQIVTDSGFECMVECGGSFHLEYDKNGKRMLHNESPNFGFPTAYITNESINIPLNKNLENLLIEYNIGYLICFEPYLKYIPLNAFYNDIKKDFSIKRALPNFSEFEHKNYKNLEPIISDFIENKINLEEFLNNIGKGYIL